MKIGKDKRGGENGENCAGGVAQDEALSSNSSTKKKKKEKNCWDFGQVLVTQTCNPILQYFWQEHYLQAVKCPHAIT
jgi:hypothetical protein